MRNVRILVVAVVVAFLLGMMAAAEAGQTPAGRGQIAVVVMDSTGATVAGAVVTLTRGAERYTMTTGAEGSALFTNLGQGDWTVTVASEGFARWQQVFPVATGSLEVPARLEVAGFSETVQVETEIGPPTQIPLNAPATGGSRLDIAVRDLPASLYLVNQELIQERGARSVDEAAQLAVGMQATIGVGSIPGYATRGWRDIDISVMRDGIRQNTGAQSARPVDAFILDRVEILKGPGSLLYGEGAIGAAVNLVSKAPAARFGADTLLSYGSFGQYRAGVGINVPLRRNLFARVDISQAGTDGYIKDSGQSLFAANTSLRFLPTSNISLKASGTYGFDDTSPYYSTPFINGGFDKRTIKTNYNMQDRLTKSTNRWGQLEGDFLVRGGWRLHNQFFAATHYMDWRNFEGYTYNPTLNTVDVTSYLLIYRDDLLLGNRSDARKTVSLGGRTLNFTFGGEIQRNDLHRSGNPLPADPRFTIVRRLDPFNPAPHFDPGFGYTKRAHVLIGTKAVYAESVLDATSRLKLVTGLRWEAISLDFLPYAAGIEGTMASKDYHPTTGRVGGVFELTPSANVYASYSRAVQPTTQLVSLDGTQQQFSMVPGRQYEVGAKGGAFGGRLDGTVAWFNIEKKDILISELIDGIRTNQQVGRQSSRGVEIAVVGRPTRSLTIAADYALTGARFDEFIEIVGTTNTSRSGNFPANIPKVIWNIAPSQQIGRFDVSAVLRQVGARWADNANSRLVGGFTTFQASLGYRLRSGSRLRLNARNLTNKIYTQSTSNTSGRLEAPRSVDLTFTLAY